MPSACTSFFSCIKLESYHTSPMTTADSITAARDQLNRTLTFFPRVDAKASVLLGVDTALIAVLMSRVGPVESLRWEWISIGVALFAIGMSYWNLYKQATPNLAGGEESLLYFNEIGRRTESKYREAWHKLSDDEYLSDLLGQVWRNSCILRQKFQHAKSAFWWLAVGLVPWTISLAFLTLRTTAN